MLVLLVRITSYCGRLICTAQLEDPLNVLCNAPVNMQMVSRIRPLAVESEPFKDLTNCCQNVL